MAHLFDALSRPMARRAAEQYVIETLTGTPVDSPVAALADLRLGPTRDRTLAAMVAALEPGPANVPWHARAALRDILDPAFTLLSREFPPPLHRAFCRMIPALDFHPVKILTALDGLTVDLVPEHGEATHVRESDLATGYETAALRTWGRIFAVSRQELTNDEALGYLATVGRALIAACYRAEAAEVFAALEANPNLNDGLPWFDATNTATGPSEPTAISAALELLCGQTFANGEYLDTPPRLLVVPASWSLGVGDLHSEMTIQRPPILFQKSPRVTHAYLFSDPATAPALGLLTLTPTPGLATGRPPLASNAGALLKVHHAFRAVPLARWGIVRISKNP